MAKKEVGGVVMWKMMLLKMTQRTLHPMTSLRCARLQFVMEEVNWVVTR